MKIAKVILFETYIPGRDFLYYSIPDEFSYIEIGSPVIVPLKKSKKIGYIWDILEATSIEYNLQPIHTQLTEIPPLGTPLIKLVNWVSDYYGNSLYRTANYIFPTGIELEIKRYLTAKDVAVDMTKKQEKVFISLFEEKTLEELKKEIGKVSESVIRELIKKGAIEERYEIIVKEKTPRKTVFQSEEISDSWGSFEIDVDNILKVFNKPLLLFVESQEKRWRIYFELLKYFYQKGKSILFLFPTIKTLLKFGEFLSDLVPVPFYFYHGLLTEAQAYKVYKIAGTERTIILSTTKGLFLPFNNLGIIIVDQEENEFYDMREKEPKYDGVKVAIKRAEFEGIPIILGSSSPSIGDFHQAISKKMFNFVRIPDLIRKKITIIDLRKIKNEDFFDSYSLKRINDMVRIKKKVLILLNRLGFSTYIQCVDCGYIFMCPHCRSPLVFHQDEDKVLKCHYCGFTSLPPTICPVCQGYNFIFGGIGTEKLERYLVKTFKKFKVLRIDSEIELQDESLIKEADIIVGTKMIEPWLDLEDAGILIVYNLDNFIHIPDFSMPEKTFNMLNRIKSFFKGEEIILRTYSPSHYVVKAIKSNSYGTFLNYELKLRKSLFYPPFSLLHQIIVEGSDEEEVVDEGKKMVAILEEKYTDLEVLGPAPFYPYLVKDKFRYQILIKDKEGIIESRILKNICEDSKTPFSNVKFIINVDVKETNL